MKDQDQESLLTSAMISENFPSPEFRLFMDVGKALTSSLSIEDVLQEIMDKVNSILRPKHWSLFLLQKQSQELYFCIAQGDVSDQIRDIRLKMGEGISGWVAQQGKPVLVADVRFDTRFSPRADKVSNFQTKSIICVPMIARGEVLGVIELVNTIDDSEFTSRDLEFLIMIADFAAIAIANARFYRRIREISLKDPLTISYNVRYLHSLLDRWLEQQTSFSLIFLDLDHFKMVVDTYGHKAGSDLLVQLALFLRVSLRQLPSEEVDSGKKLSHSLIRYGGDEFIIMLEAVAKADAYHFATHLLMDLQQKKFLLSDSDEVTLSASLGVAHFPSDAVTKKEIMILADHAMFAAKNKGRGQVIMAGE